MYLIRMESRCISSRVQFTNRYAAGIELEIFREFHSTDSARVYECRRRRIHCNIDVKLQFISQCFHVNI